MFDDDAMTVLAIPGRAESCVVSFTGIGHAMGGVDLQSPEFTRACGEEMRLFIIDKKRSWGNGLDWVRIEHLVKELASDAEITTLGNSMGGFLACLAANRLGASCAIAFAPQWSIDPRIVPEETRWMTYRREIGVIRHRDLDSALVPPCRFHVFFGADGTDDVHLRFFRAAEDRLALVCLEGCGHDVARHLKETGQLYPVIEACRSSGDVEAVLADGRPGGTVLLET